MIGLPARPLKAFVLALLIIGGNFASHCTIGAEPTTTKKPTSEDVLAGLKKFYAKTAREDGSFTNGIDPAYQGMSDSAYSDMAAVTYACTIHKTFGWKLPHEAKTVEFLLGRQRKSDGAFFNVAGTVKPDSAQGKTYNTTQGLVALHALGVKPNYDPLPVFEEILKADYKELPAFSTSFFPLAYLCYGKPIPAQADRGIRALMVQDETGYTNDHIAATFHASHYYHLIGEKTPKSKEMVARILRDQRPDGSWMLFTPARDRHATFDAVFTLLHEGRDADGKLRDDCRQAIDKAANWALTCRNDDGGFGHYPGSTSDADANYFHVGTLVMAGYLKPVDPLPKDPHLLSWGHLMPVAQTKMEKLPGEQVLEVHTPGWVGGVSFSADGKLFAAGVSDRSVRIFDAISGKEIHALKLHRDPVTAVQFHPKEKLLASGSLDHWGAIWNSETGKIVHGLPGHRGAVLDVAFSPDGETLATASIDQTIKLWKTATGKSFRTLSGHKSWVNSLAYSPDGKWLASGSSDGTVKIWATETGEPLQTLKATDAEVRSLAFSPDGKLLATGMRYGQVKVWQTEKWIERHDFKAHPEDVWAIRFSLDGKTLATGGGEWNRPGTVKLWNAETGKLAAQLQHTGEVLCLDFSPDGKRIIAGAGDKMIRVWLLPAIELDTKKTP